MTTIRHIQTLFSEGTMGGLTDGELLAKFKDSGAGAEAAFATLVERHGRMVFSACQTILNDPNDAQDAFQATFLTLARRAKILWVRESLAPWLHRVAIRTALCARSAAARRTRHEHRASRPEAHDPADPWGEDAGRILHEEIGKLPERYRLPIILCGLEGQTREQAAQALGCPPGTVQSRLARGRERLRDRLARRGISPMLPVLGLKATARVPRELAEQVTHAAVRFAGGNVATVGMVSADVLALTEGVIYAMFMTKLKLTAAVLFAVAMTAAGASVRARQGDVPNDPVKVSRADHDISPKVPHVVARVNGVPITRAQLVERCLSQHGPEILDRLISEEILRGALKRKGLKVTDEEIDAQVFETASAQKKSVDEWYNYLAKERQISKDRYLEDIVRPSLMVKKLAVANYGAEFDRLKKETSIEIVDRSFQPVMQSEDAGLHRQTTLKIDGGPSRQPHSEASSTPRARTTDERLDDLERKFDQVIKALKP